MFLRYLILCLSLFYIVTSQAQPLDNATIETLIGKYKQDSRGPYKDIRWFCKDGSTVAPKESCPEPGGFQRARYKDEVLGLAEKNHIFLGQILSTTEQKAFWDEKHYNSRFKQYQLEKYLRSVDDGWVLQKAQFYRGAFQVEDEQAWGKEFLTWLMADNERLRKNFFLVRQAVKHIPHNDESDKAQSVRALSKSISLDYEPFMNLRIKIHGQPDESDLAAVKAFKTQHLDRLTANLVDEFERLIADMEELYKPIELASLKRYSDQLPKELYITQSINQFISDYHGEKGHTMVMASAEILAEIRNSIFNVKKGASRLALLDISNELEQIMFRELGHWPVKNLEEALDKLCYLGLAVVGTGFIEQWEWEAISGRLIIDGESISLNRLISVQDGARSLLEWGTAMPYAYYKDVVNLYGAFEPLAYGFYDDLIRSSVLLYLGAAVGQLGDFVSAEASVSNKVLNIPNQSHIRGLNPGYSTGELVVLDHAGEELEVSADKIYVFERPPADLKPVGGIATVSEGNLVSHVQLLARNLGIPNAVISSENFADLKKYAGQQIFYAVTAKGNVILKPASQMTVNEEKLFEVKKRDENKVTVPVDKIDLERKTLINLRDIDATASGKLCGPKAANLGQLKVLFPEHVVEGIVIPFGVFREHLEQIMPGESISYWQYLNNVFSKAQALEAEGKSNADIEQYLLVELDKLKNAIKNIPFLPGFKEELEQAFVEIFGDKMGKVPVFLRSDTNMEDLKEFTGAGLNLTLFNVVAAEKIIQGIKDVWASPYTERSYKWRQQYLLNPENVYPSILIIPSVDVDHSGVLITKGITSGSRNDLTVAFSRGAGGAVEGQAAESYLILPNGSRVLLSPSRELFYIRLPKTGGTEKHSATFEEPILSWDNIWKLSDIATDIKQKLPTAPGVETEGPFDVELGFKDGKLWLFQVRPFVESKKALSSEYLQSITPKIPGNKMIRLSTAL